MTKTLQQIAQETGIAYQTLKKHAQRGKLRVTTSGERMMVSDEDLQAYLLIEDVAVLVRKAQGAPLEAVVEDLGNIYAQLPQHLRDAILAGIPTTKSPGSPKPWLDARAAHPTNPPRVGSSSDHHFGHPKGYQHTSHPRWKRTGLETWTLGSRSYTWNGFGWESPDGKVLPEGVSPASPFSNDRPLGPSNTVKDPR